MGEATYYLKATFDKKINSKLIKELTFFLNEGAEAQDFWQANRGMKDGDLFWLSFKEKFPIVSEYLKKAKLFGGDHNNDLAGYLDFPSNDDGRHLEFGNEKMYYSGIVWHFAEWDPLAKFLEAKFGATEVKWVSDEHVDMWDVLDNS